MSRILDARKLILKAGFQLAVRKVRSECSALRSVHYENRRRMTYNIKKHILAVLQFYECSAFYFQDDHSPNNVKFPDIFLTVCGTPPWHSAC